MINNYITKEEFEIESKASLEAMREWDNKEADKGIKILKRVKKRVSSSWYKSIIEYIEDCDFTRDFSIVDKPEGKRQKESYRFSYLYVDQYCNGGYSGDDFAGKVCLPIRGGLYLKFHYSC
jgi:hypothetical protein